jgi:hypothetical protein
VGDQSLPIARLLLTPDSDGGNGLRLATGSVVVEGSFVGRSQDAIFIAQPSDQRQGCVLTVIPIGRVQQLNVGDEPSERCTPVSPATTRPLPQVRGLTSCGSTPDRAWTSIDITSVSLPQRLWLPVPTFEPRRDRLGEVSMAVTVCDTRGYRVRNARVLIRAAPRRYFRASPKQTRTDDYGIAELTLKPSPALCGKARGRIAIFLKAWNDAEGKPLGGVSIRRLVQFPIGRLRGSPGC